MQTATQFNPADSIRSKTAPEVLFVDEDGNPIEAGRENVIFVDEIGNEIAEEAALDLLQSGRYLDSRDLNQDSNTSTHSRSAAAFSQATFNASQASLPASAFGSLSKSTGGHSHMMHHAAEFQRKYSSNALNHPDSRASFVQSQVKSLADTTQLDAIQSTSQYNKTDPLKSTSHTEVQKSHSGRRIAQPPPKRSEDVFNSTQSYDGHEKEFQQQVIELQNLINNENRMNNVQDQSRVFDDGSTDEDNILRVRQSVQHHTYQEVPNPRSQGGGYSSQPAKQRSEFYVHQNLHYSQDPSYSQPLNTHQTSPQRRQNHLNRSSADEEEDTWKSVGRDARERINSMGGTGAFAIKSMNRIGYLIGDQVIRDLNKVDTRLLEPFYEKGARLESLEFEPTDLDIKPNQFIDPFSPDLFKDEIIDIDFGAIDAFTSALNAQLNAEKSGHPAPQNLQFPSHILTSNHAAFIDNQLLLGDSSINAGVSGGTGGSGGGGAGVDGSSGINVQFISSSKDFNQSHSNLNGSAVFRDEVGYSRSNSFGSIIDIQSQSYATSQATRPTRSLVIDNVPNELAGLINLEDLNSALNRISAENGGGNTGLPGTTQMSQTKLISALQDIVRNKQQQQQQQQRGGSNDYVLIDQATAR